jgi:hypothetical protein
VAARRDADERVGAGFANFTLHYEETDIKKLVIVADQTLEVK